MSSFNEESNREAFYEESNREAFYEEQNERILAIECGEYDCGQSDDEYIYDWMSQESLNDDNEEDYEEKDDCEICEENHVDEEVKNVDIELEMMVYTDDANTNE